MTERDLYDYSADHLYYELWMLYETAWTLRDRDILDAWVLKNALIESFLIHARSLAMFLYSPDVKRYPTDVTSDDFVKDIEQWRQARGMMPELLKTVIERTGKQIAHLTTKRYAPGDPRKAWSPEPILLAFDKPLRLFVEHARPSCLDVSVRAVVAHVTSPDTTATVPAGSLPESPGGTVPTDVSTTRR